MTARSVALNTMKSTCRSSLYHIYKTKNEEGHKIVSLTLTLKVNRQDHVTHFGLFEITDLDIVRIDSKIMFVSCMQPKI